jgi:hypothetical protein
MGCETLSTAVVNIHLHIRRACGLTTLALPCFHFARPAQNQLHKDYVEEQRLDVVWVAGLCPIFFPDVLLSPNCVWGRGPFFA